jgi:hypothetical protein
MRRILLSIASVALLAVPSAAAARSHAPGFLVVRGAATDGGVTGRPVVTVVVDGFVLGSVSLEGRVEIYDLTAGAARGTGQATGVDVSRAGVTWHGVPGTVYSGSAFRFRAVGGVWRVVIRGSGISVYAGGHGHVTLHGSVAYPHADGRYSLDGRGFESLPSGELTRSIGSR